MATYKVVRADLKADRAKLIDLLVRNEPEMPRQADQLAWHLERNPHGEGRAWLLLTEPEGKVIGMTALVMRHMQVNGEVLLAGRTWGVSVDREHRTLGPAIQLARAALEELDKDLAFVFVLPYTKTAATLFARVGYKRMGYLDRYVRVLRSKPYLQNLAHHQVLQSRVLQHPLVQQTLAGPLAEVLAPPADLATWMAIDRPWERPRELALHWLSGFDERFDRLWQHAHARYGVTCERSSDFLAWRYRRSWDSFLTLGFSPPGAEQHLAGYAMLGFDRQQAIVVDLFLEEPVALAPAALWLIVDWARAHGFGSVSMAFAGAPRLQAELQKRWFVDTSKHDGVQPRPAKPAPRAEDQRPDQVLVAVAKSRPELPAIDSWHFTLGDDV